MAAGSLSSDREQRLCDVAAAYLEAVEAGQPDDRAGLLARHPDLADELRALLDEQDHMARLARPVRDVALPAPAGGALLPGFALGEFRIVREVARGGMGIVYEAVQVALGRRVALKVLPFAATLDARQLARFRTEAQAAAQLHHGNIVPVYWVGQDRGLHYYAMQYIDGQNLAAVIQGLRRQAMPGETTPADGGAQAAARSTERLGREHFRTAARLGVQAAEALDYAHQMGIVHRDVKPANLLLDGKGDLWVTDFGLARLQNDLNLTTSGDLIGTLRYMSPEQAMAKRLVVDHRTDVYSLGATLYELLALEPAVGGKDREEVLREITFDEPKAPRRVNKAIPAELETIVLKALEKNPADRYPTAQALADDLRRYLANEPIWARRSSLVQRARKVARRHPGATVTAAVALVAGLVLGVAGLAVNNRMVRQEQLRTQDALERAEQEKAIAQAVRRFLRDKLLIQAVPRAQADAVRRAGGKPAGLKPNPTIRELLDRAASELTPDRIDDQFPGQPLVQAELLKTVGEAYGGIGDYGKAAAHLGRAREVQTRELGPDHPDTLATTHALARVYLDDGKAREAAQLFELVRDRRSETLGPNHPDTLASMNDLVRCYYRLGQHQKALALREEIARVRNASLGREHPDTLESRSHLANSYAIVGRLEEALRLHEETLALRKLKLGDDDPATLDSLNNVANCHAALGRYAESLKLHREALERRRTTLGSDDPNTLQSMNNVAVACAALGRHAEALKLYRETLALRKAKLTPEHRDTVQSTNALAWILANCPDRTLRDPGKALELAKQAVKLAPAQGGYWNTLGAAHYRTGDWKSAVAALTRSLELRKGGDAADWFFLAMAHSRLGDKEQARKWYDQAVGWMEKNKPEDEEMRCFRAEAAELLGIGKQ